jgi:hypothetical protein
MTIPEIFEAVKELGSGVVILIGIVYFAIWFLKEYSRQAISQGLSATQEAYNSKTAELQTRFSKLHERRVSRIDELQEKVANTIRFTFDYIKVFVPVEDESEEDRGKKAVETFNELVSYFLNNEIYFDEKFCSVMQSFLDKNKEIIQDFQRKDFPKPSRVDTWSAVFETFNTDLKDLQKELANEFREMLGTAYHPSSAETSPPIESGLISRFRKFLCR